MAKSFIKLNVMFYVYNFLTKIEIIFHIYKQLTILLNHLKNKNIVKTLQKCVFEFAFIWKNNNAVQNKHQL